MRNILLIIYLSLTPIFVATAATDIDSMECVLAKMPSGDRLVKLDELASDKGQGLDYKYYADRLSITPNYLNEVVQQEMKISPKCYIPFFDSYCMISLSSSYFCVIYKLKE